MNSVQGAVLSGAVKIIAVDMLDNKLEAARLFGATHTINAGRQDAVAAVLELTGGRGADYAFATVGSSKAIAQASQMIRPGGTAVIVGMPSNAEAPFTLNAHNRTYIRDEPIRWEDGYIIPPTRPGLKSTRRLLRGIPTPGNDFISRCWTNQFHEVTRPSASRLEGEGYHPVEVWLCKQL